MTGRLVDATARKDVKALPEVESCFARFVMPGRTIAAGEPATAGARP